MSHEESGEEIAFMKYRGERVVSRTKILEPEIQETMDERWSDIEDNEGRNIEHGLSLS